MKIFSDHLMKIWSKLKLNFHLIWMEMKVANWIHGFSSDCYEPTPMALGYVRVYC